MNESEAVTKIRRKLGIDPGTTIEIPLESLLNLIRIVSEAIGSIRNTASVIKEDESYSDGFVEDMNINAEDYSLRLDSIVDKIV